MKIHKFQQLIRDAHFWSEITKDATVVVRVDGVEQPVTGVKVRDGVVIVEC